jgi:hypothetical protein
MSLVIGLSVERDRLRAVGVSGVRVLWGMDVGLSDETPLGEVLPKFLGTLPVGRFARPRITIALGSAFAQSKRLGGLPPLGDERVLARTVSEHSSRFFLKNGVPLVTTSVRLDAGGRPWAAALQKNIVDTIVTACRESRVRLSGIVPAVDVALLETTALTPLGREAKEFAAAYGAAITSGALTWHAGPGGGPDAAPRWRVATAASSAIFALGIAVLTPGFAAHLVEHRAVAHLASIARPSRAAQRVARDNELVTHALEEVGTFDSGRRPVTVVMARLAVALPDSAALLALRIDSVGGSIVAIVPHAGALLTRLEHVRGLAAPEITGPVTREVAPGRDLERVTVRFRWTARP